MKKECVTELFDAIPIANIDSANRLWIDLEGRLDLVLLLGRSGPCWLT